MDFAVDIAGMEVDGEYRSRHNNWLKRNILQEAFGQPYAALTDSNDLLVVCWAEPLLKHWEAVSVSGNTQYYHRGRCWQWQAPHRLCLRHGSLQAGFHRKICAFTGIFGGTGHCQRLRQIQKGADTVEKNRSAHSRRVVAHLPDGNGSERSAGDHPRQTQMILCIRSDRLVQQVPGGDHCGRHSGPDRSDSYAIKICGADEHSQKSMREVYGVGSKEWVEYALA